MMDLRVCFKLGNSFQMIPSLFALAWAIYGITLYQSTTDPMCQSVVADGWNARTVLWWFSVPQIICLSCLVCCLIPVCIAGGQALVVLCASDHLSELSGVLLDPSMYC